MSQVQAVGLAMARLKRGVVICCWLAMLSLLAQTVVWSLATFTDMRYQSDQEHAAADSDGRAAQAIVKREDARRSGGLRAPGAAADAAEPRGSRSADADQPRQLGSNERHFRVVVNISAMAATLGVLALLPLLSVGVILAAGAATPGVDKTVSALLLLLIVAALMLPVAKLCGIEGFSGAVSHYEPMMVAVEAARQAEAEQMLGSVAAATGKTVEKPGSEKTAADAAGSDKADAASDAGGNTAPTGAAAMASAALAPTGGGMEFYFRYLLLPLTCIIGLALLALRFSAGVEAAIVRTDYRLDPALEREAANMKASSLHGSGRNSAALGGTIAAATTGPAGAPLSATQVSPGVAPRRII